MHGTKYFLSPGFLLALFPSLVCSDASKAHPDEFDLKNATVTGRGESLLERAGCGQRERTAMLAVAPVLFFTCAWCFAQEILDGFDVTSLYIQLTLLQPAVIE